MLTRIFTKRVRRPRFSPQARALLKMSDLDVSSANCTLVQTADGESVMEDLGRSFFFKCDGQLMIKDRAIFVTTPEGIKAENRDCFQGKGEILSLWFLHDRVPRAIECRVEERVRFPSEMLEGMDPKVGIGYKLTPLSDVVKQDKRSSLRFSHQPGRGALPVYPQTLFDTFACRTDIVYPAEGTLPLWLENFGLVPPRNAEDDAEELGYDPAKLVEEFKESMRNNPWGDRTVHVSKPFLEERHNRSILLELGFSDVLGLGSEEAGRTLHIKKPLPSRIKDRRDPRYLSIGNTLVLHYGARSPLDGHYRYYQLVTEISKGGLENITIRPQSWPHEERGMRVALVDFCVNGVRFDSSPDFVSYLLGREGSRIPVEKQMDRLLNTVLLFHFYPRLRFTRETEIYRPELPKRVSVLGRIVRCEVKWEDEEKRREGRIRSLGVKFMYDPVEYSRDNYDFDRWEIIRPFRKNKYFKEVHKSLNGLIAYLESQTKE